MIASEPMCISALQTVLQPEHLCTAMNHILLPRSSKSSWLGICVPTEAAALLHAREHTGTESSSYTPAFISPLLRRHKGLYKSAHRSAAEGLYRGTGKGRPTRSIILEAGNDAETKEKTPTHSMCFSASLVVKLITLLMGEKTRRLQEVRSDQVANF